MDFRPSDRDQVAGQGAAFFLRVRPFLSKDHVEFTVFDQDEDIKFTAISDAASAIALCERTTDLINGENPSALIIVDIDPSLSQRSTGL